MILVSQVTGELLIGQLCISAGAGVVEYKLVALETFIKLHGSYYSWLLRAFDRWVNGQIKKQRVFNLVGHLSRAVPFDKRFGPS